MEQRGVSGTVYAAGARHVRMFSEPMVAAIGAGVPPNQPSDSMELDIDIDIGGGGGATESSFSPGVVFSRPLCDTLVGAARQ